MSGEGQVAGWMRKRQLYKAQKQDFDKETKIPQQNQPLAIFLIFLLLVLLTMSEVFLYKSAH
ncbi:hypothetical protein [Agrobacterium rosae]|uniref:hypothetical protein n=1 Tax=Agrobacterium rosae TaxID=1972867 RepID=UPI00117829A1|nr:hypothetical protein [Agrobacterium rosae]